MRLKPQNLLTLLALFVALLLVGCGDDEGPTVDGTDSEINVALVSTPPAMGNMPSDPVWDNIDQASIRVGTDSVYMNYQGPGIVRVKALTDGSNVYFRFDWSDSSETIDPGRWYFNSSGTGSVFELEVDTIRDQNGNITLSAPERFAQAWEDEDVVAMFIDYGNNGSEGANCASTCHTAEEVNGIGERHYTTGGGNIDCWVWRAGRTDPLGIAEDYFWGPNRKYDSYDHELYFRNTIAPDSLDPFVSDPAWMHTDSSDYQGLVLFSDDTTKIDFADAVGWQAGDGVPGWITNSDYMTGNTSRYDVKAESLYDPQINAWIVVLWRSLAAPNASEDVTFQLGQEYEATLAIMRNTNLRHSGSQPFTIKFPSP